MADHGSIDPVALLPSKRSRRDLNWQLCIICQTTQKEESLCESSEQGINKIKKACDIRLSHNDLSYENTLYRLMPFVDSLTDNKPKWHKSCYASFTSKVNLHSITKRHNQKKPDERLHSDAPDAYPTLTRIAVPQVRKLNIFKTVLSLHIYVSCLLSPYSSLQENNIFFQVDWKKCIFCQSRKREVIHLVQSFEVHERIHRCAAADYALKCRIGQNDLVAYEAHYHKCCKVKAERKPLPNSYDVSDRILRKTAIHQACHSCQSRSGKWLCLQYG